MMSNLRGAARSQGAFAALVVLACTASLAITTTASGSLPPKKPLVVNIERGMIGTVRIGDSLLQFAFAWGPPDASQPAQPPAVVEAFSSWRSSLTPPWAVVTFADADAQHADAIFYRGPFETARGDKNGTSLKAFLGHWREHGLAGEVSGRQYGLNGYTRVKVRSAYFFFAKSALVAVQVGDGTAADWASWTHF
jgi:hypothetical protein